MQVQFSNNLALYTSMRLFCLPEWNHHFNNMLMTFFSSRTLGGQSESENKWRIRPVEDEPDQGSTQDRQVASNTFQSMLIHASQIPYSPIACISGRKICGGRKRRSRP
jgi:hypothetical protein